MATDIDELIRRLLNDRYDTCACHVMKEEAADTLTTLQSAIADRDRTIAELREGLRAAAGALCHPWAPVDECAACRARKALAQKETPDGA